MKKNISFLMKAAPQNAASRTLRLSNKPFLKARLILTLFLFCPLSLFAQEENAASSAADGPGLPPEAAGEAYATDEAAAGGGVSGGSNVSQSGPAGTTPHESPAASGTVYVIRKIDFDIDGRTRPFALIYNGELREGERVSGKENFDKYIARKRQELINQRVLEDASIEYTLGEPEENGDIPVDLLVSVKDTWNFIILPYPKYDSNEGFSVTLKTRDYNFLGSMSPLQIDLGYLRSIKDDETKNVFNFELNSDTPFYAGGLNWNLNFDHFLEYTDGESLYYKNITGVSVELPVSFTTVTLGIDQYLIVNEENTQAAIDEYGLDERMDGAYGATELYASWKIPLGLDIGSFGELSYTPRLSGKAAYRPGGVDEPRRPSAALSQTLGFGRINWIGNYRDGLEASIGNTNTFYISPYDYGISLEAAVTWHRNLFKLLGVSSRLRYQHWFNELHYDAADVLRGIPDAHLRSEYMLSLNLDMPFRILRFTPSEWFSSRKMRLFDFDMHLSPFVDIAFLKGLQSSSSSGPFSDRSFQNALVGGGFELIVFPASFRSFYLRISAGYNITEIYDTGDIPKWDELFIGIGHHY